MLDHLLLVIKVGLNVKAKNVFNTTFFCIAQSDTQEENTFIQMLYWSKRGAIHSNNKYMITILLH